jgi:hypothetical protein
MPLFPKQKETILRTGIRPRSSTNPHMSRQRKAVAAIHVPNPVEVTPNRGPVRSSLIGEKPPFDFESIDRAYLAEGLLRQAIDKYVEAIVNEGWFLEGEEEPRLYIEERIRQTSLSTGKPFDLVLDSIVREFVKFGNTLVLIARIPNSTPGIAGRRSIAGLFPLPVTQMVPVYSKAGAIESWDRNICGRKIASYKPSDVLHFVYCETPGSLWGAPPMLAAVEEARAYRKAEDSVFRLIDKHLNPLIHQEVPDTTGDGSRQEDVDFAVSNIQQMAVDGFLITPHGHKLTVLGAESHALRAENYLRLFKLRLYADMGVSELIMGESKAGTSGSADTIATQMHHRIKYYQSLLSCYLTNFLINELLLEGGFNPWANEEDRVTWKWHEIELDKRIKKETHAINQFTQNTITQTEARNRCRLKPLSEEEKKDMYLETVQLPQIKAKATLGPENGAAKNIVSPKNQHNMSAIDIPKLASSIQGWIQVKASTETLDSIISVLPDPHIRLELRRLAILGDVEGIKSLFVDEYYNEED